ncbi:unnamed protein product [Cyclocybe aegerita]|uniref:Uncharacterized protein n=1 Tax=Cyclocybe aegerita TaxID=1973307 RepID=A0A8S0WRA4_CYCAE|nr:unnamed protein product [Cyclocybe aegerita]
MLHLSGEEKNRFQDLVQAHPTVGPLGLIVGVPGINGPGKSVTEISDIFWNADRVSKERSKIKQGADVGGDGFIAAFKKLEEDHPEFVVSSTFGIVTVVSLQTPFMRSLLVRDTTLEEPVNGTVNDATHGWWSERNALLIVTSVYDVKTQSWSPSLFSYSNGARTLHFKYHFVALFQGIAEEADSRGIDIEDRLFAGVMDFSEAEHGAFIEAFVEFFSGRLDDTRTVEELHLAAEHLTRGCQEHYRASVTRVSRIGGAVPPEKVDAFKDRALGLLNAPDSDAFLERASLLIRDFPSLKSWMAWWMRPSNASRLFESERLGRWKHAHEIETSEDILADPTSIPFSNEVECALRPAEGVLRDLLLDPQVVDSNQVPAKKPLTRTIVPEVGSLSLLDRAQVSNWFEINISKDPNLRQEWLAYLPIAHAHTVLIASRLRGYQVFQELTEVALIDRAWERSERAGVAGHYQWGLDSGDHQGGWDPYQGLPYHWNRGDRDGSEDEMQRGPNFIEVEMVSPVPQKKPRVRPRPIKVKSKMHTSRS